MPDDSSSFEIIDLGTDPDSLWTDVSDLKRALFEEQPQIPSYYGYDQVGSELFEALTRAPQYYLTRVETSMLEAIAPELAGHIAGTSLLELGSGSAKKSAIVVKACAELAPPHFVPLDVDLTMMKTSFDLLSAEVPGLRFSAVVGRYEETLGLLSTRAEVAHRCVLALGSNVGNMLQNERLALLDTVAAALTEGEYFFLTADLVKSRSVLEQAYNDPPHDRTHTDFRFNRFTHLNRLHHTAFRHELFYEYATYNTQKERIEVHLYSVEDQVIDLGDLDCELELRRGDSIVIDYSVKFRADALCAELAARDFELVESWIDHRYRYGAFLFRRTAGSAP